MIKNLANCFTVTRNKVHGLFTFLNFVPKYFFWVNLFPKLESTLFKLKLDIERYSRLLILNSTIVFVNFDPKITLDKFGSET